jgi:Carboxypeptidase regulatory-like domain
MRRLKSLLLCLILTIFGSIRAIDAQTTAGSILGDVNDSSGAEAARRHLTARNQENGAVRETVTDALGTYNFSALPAGPTP